MILRKWHTNNKQLREKCLGEVIARIGHIEDPKQVGIIAAQEIVDIVLENLAPKIYNQGVADTRDLLRKRMGDIDIEIEMLKQE